MNEPNELKKKIYHEMSKGQSYSEKADFVSKFFLEEIKEAFEAGKQFGSDIQWLKSKYNIDHQER